MRKILAVILLFAAGFFGFSGALCAGDTVRMVGSSTVFKKIVQPSMRGIEKQGITIEENIKGTGPGFIALDKREADVLLASADLSEVLKAAKTAGWTQPADFDPSEYHQIKIYEDDIIVLTNYANKVKKLSADQLRGIFGGTIRNWKELGGADLPIMLVIPEKGRATRQVFEDTIMNGMKLALTCYDASPTAGVSDIVRANESAIGFTSTAFFFRGKLRIVDTVKLSRPLLLITKGKPSPAVKKIGDFLTGKGRKYWEDQDLTPFWMVID